MSDKPADLCKLTNEELAEAMRRLQERIAAHEAEAARRVIDDAISIPAHPNATADSLEQNEGR